MDVAQQTIQDGPRMLPAYLSSAPNTTDTPGSRTRSPLFKGDESLDSSMIDASSDSLSVAWHITLRNSLLPTLLGRVHNSVVFRRAVPNGDRKGREAHTRKERGRPKPPPPAGARVLTGSGLLPRNSASRDPSGHRSSAARRDGPAGRLQWNQDGPGCARSRRRYRYPS